MHFVYVFRREDAERLEAEGLKLVKHNSTHDVWVFEHCEDIALFSDLKCVVSDVMTF